MKKLTKTILKRTIWLGRGAATVMGLAMLLALTVGLTSTALAGTGIGKRFDLGKINAVDTVSTLAGSFSGPMLRIDNGLPDNPKFLNSTALDLRVEPGNPPMTVNSSDKVNNLNADQLDGRDSSQLLSVFGKAADADRLDGKDSSDFLPGKTYAEFGDPLTFSDRQVRFVRASCDPGDAALSGGHDFSTTTETPTVSREVTQFNQQELEIVAPRDESITAQAVVVCADLPPLR